MRSGECDLYYEEIGEGVPILLIHPAGATASTWGAATEELARAGRVITYDRRGYARSGGEPARSISTHTADAAAILESLPAQPAVVVGTSAGAAIAVDLAVRRPDLARVVIAHEFPWRFTRHLPSVSQVAALTKIGLLALRGRQGDAAETLLRSAYTYRDGGSAWDAFPEEWRRAGRDNARAALADFRNSITDYPSPTDLATVEVPVVCSYGARSPDSMFRLVRSLAAAIPTARTHRIEGAGHAAPFDATADFVQLIANTITSYEAEPERSHHRAGGQSPDGAPIAAAGRDDVSDAREDVRDRQWWEAMGLEPTWGEVKMPSVGVQRMDSGPVRVVGRELMIRFVRGAFHAEQDGSKGHDTLASAHAVTTVTEAARQAT